MANDEMRITQVASEVIRAVIQAITAANMENSTRQSMGPKVSGPMMKQPTFSWDMEDKYNQLKASE